MRKIVLKLARQIIPKLPKGRSFVMNLALLLGGNTFKDVITVSDGRKFRIGRISLVKKHLFFLNQYEDYETSIIRSIVGLGDYVFDVGASFGWFTTLMSDLVGDRGRVFAFELVPGIAEECRNNIRLNHQKNVVVEEVGLGDSEGTVDYHYSDELGLGNLRREGFNGGGVLETGKSAITTLDHYVEKNAIAKVDFIKCDVDGAEILFLKGARRTLASHKPVIVIEASGAHGRQSCYEIFKELNQFGYKFFSLHYKLKLRPIEEKNFTGNFKENILCLPSDKLSLLEVLPRS